MTQTPRQEEPISVKFRHWDCWIRLRRYPNNGRLGLELIDRRTGDSLAWATVNSFDVPFGKDEILIRDYNDAKGILRAVRDARVVKPTGKSVQSGDLMIHKCRLTINLPEDFREGTHLKRGHIESYRQQADRQMKPRM